MCGMNRNRPLLDARGFSLTEVLISMLITVIVMAAVYGLLLRGQQAFQREPQVVDLQQNGRSALAAVSADVLQAGTGLPPEYEAFTTKATDPTVGDSGGLGNPDVIEIVGNIVSPDQPSNQPEPFSAFNGATLTLVDSQTNFAVGDLVAVYDNLPVNPSWWTGWICGVNPGPPPILSVDQSCAPPGHAAVPLNYHDLDPAGSGDPAATGWTSGQVTRISVVRYFAVPDTSGQFVTPPRVLMRQVNFAVAPQPVAYIEDFQVAYIRDTDADGDLQDEVDEKEPPLQKPPAGTQIAARDIVRSVRISVKARSMGENMQGSRTADAAQGEVGNLIRRTFSTMVSPRNIASGLGVRSVSGPGGPQYQ